MNRIEQTRPVSYLLLPQEPEEISPAVAFQNREKKLREDYESNRRDLAKFEKVVDFYSCFQESKLTEWIKLYGKDSRLIVQFCRYYNFLYFNISQKSLTRESLKEFIKENPDHLEAWCLYLFSKWKGTFPPSNEDLFVKLERISIGLENKDPALLHEAEMLPESDPLGPLFIWIKSAYYFQIHGSLTEKYRLLLNETAEKHFFYVLIDCFCVEDEWLTEFLKKIVENNPSNNNLAKSYCKQLALNNKFKELSLFIDERLAILNLYKTDFLLEDFYFIKVEVLKRENRISEALDLCLKKKFHFNKAKYQLLFLEVALGSRQKQRYKAIIDKCIDYLYVNIEIDIIVKFFNILNENGRDEDIIKLLKIAFILDGMTIEIVEKLRANKLYSTEIIYICHIALLTNTTNKELILRFCVNSLIKNFQHADLILYLIDHLDLDPEDYNFDLAYAYLIQGSYSKIEEVLQEHKNPRLNAFYNSYLALRSKNWEALEVHFESNKDENIKKQIRGVEAFEKGNYELAKKYFEALPFKDSEVKFYYWHTLRKLNLTQDAENYCDSLPQDQSVSLLDDESSSQLKPTLFEKYISYEIKAVEESIISEEKLLKLVWFFVNSKQIHKVVIYELLKEPKYKHFLITIHNLAKTSLAMHVRLFPDDEMGRCLLWLENIKTMTGETPLEQVLKLTKLRNQGALALLKNLDQSDLSILVTYYVQAVFLNYSPPSTPNFTNTKRYPFLPLIFSFKSINRDLRQYLIHLSDYIEDLFNADFYNPATQELWVTLLMVKGKYEEACNACARFSCLWDSLKIPENTQIFLRLKIKIIFLQHGNYKGPLELCNDLALSKIIDYEFFLLHIELLDLEPKDNSKLIGSIIEKFLSNISNIEALYELFFLLKEIKFTSYLGLVYQKIISSPDFFYCHNLENNDFEAPQILIFHDAALKNGENETSKASIRVLRIKNLIRCFSNPKTITDDIAYLSNIPEDTVNKGLNYYLIMVCLIEGDYAAAEKKLNEIDEAHPLGIYARIYLSIKSKNWEQAEETLKIADIPHLKGLLAYEKGDYLQAKQYFENESFKNKEVKLAYFKTLVQLNESDKAKEFYDSLPADIKLTHSVLKIEYEEWMKKTAKPLAGKVKSGAKPPHKEHLGFVEKEEKKGKIKEFDPLKLIGPLAYPYDPRFQNEGGPDPIAELTFHMRKAKIEALALISQDNQEEVSEDIKEFPKSRPVLSHKIEFVPAREKEKSISSPSGLPEGVEVITAPSKVTNNIFLFSGPYAIRLSNAVKCLEELLLLESAPMNVRIYLCIKAFELIHPTRVLTHEEEVGIALLNQYGIKTESLKNIRNTIVHYSHLLDGFVVLQFCKKLKETNLLSCLQEALMLTQVPNKSFNCDLFELKVIDPKWIKRSDDWAIEVKLSTWYSELERNLKLIPTHFQKGFENVKREHLLCKEDLNHLKIIKIAIINVRTLIYHIKEVDRESGLKLEASYLELIIFGNKFAHAHFSLEDITLELCLSFAKLASQKKYL